MTAGSSRCRRGWRPSTSKMGDPALLQNTPDIAALLPDSGGHPPQISSTTEQGAQGDAPSGRRGRSGGRYRWRHHRGWRRKPGGGRGQRSWERERETRPQNRYTPHRVTDCEVVLGPDRAAADQALQRSAPMVCSLSQRGQASDYSGASKSTASWRSLQGDGALLHRVGVVGGRMPWPRELPQLRPIPTRNDLGAF